MEMRQYITPADYETAKQNGICERTLISRVKLYDWDLERATTQPIQKKNGTAWERWKNIAEANGISYDAFHARVNRFGYTKKKAATTPIGASKKKSDLWGRWEETATEKGVYMKMFYNRLRLGWTEEDAATTPILKKGQRRN